MTDTRVHPKKSLGQNFLQDENIVRKIVASLCLDQNARVLEIGPGRGALTGYLVKLAGKVVAVEVDKNLVNRLRQQFLQYSNLELHHHDILKVSFDEILKKKYRWKVVANLPYHITSPVLFKLFDNCQFFASATMMVQKEVADRIVASAGSKTYGILSVFSQFYSDVQKLFDVSRHVFYPKPDVNSAVIRLQFNRKFLLNPDEQVLFRTVVKATFGQRRKMLSNSLKSVIGKNFDTALLEFDLSRRPESLTIDEFIELTKQVGVILLNYEN